MKKILYTVFLSLFSLLALTLPQITHAVAQVGLLESTAAGLGKGIMGCEISKETKNDIFNTLCDDEVSINLEKWIGGSKTSKQQSLLGTTTNLIASTISNPPASSGYYLADLGKNAGLIPQAYAQGVGFSALTPVLPLWKAFRNMTYFLFVIIFVIIGFAIMFRAQLNPQTVVSIQSALPNLVITLLLITFSYAIAGLIIDFMYISIYFMITMFKLTNLNIDASNPLEKIAFNDGIISNMWGLITGIGTESAESIGVMVSSVMGDWGFDAVAGVVSSVFGFLIIAIAIIIAMFRTWFALIGAYIQIIVAVVTAPFQIMLNALPGSNGFQNWLRNLIANIMVFPAVIGMLFMAYLFSENSTWQEGFKAQQLADGFTGVTGGLVSLGIVMLMPEVVKIVKGALQVQESQLGQMAGEGFGRGNFVAGGWNMLTGMTTSGLQNVGGTAIVGAGSKGLKGAWNRFSQRKEVEHSEQAQTRARRSANLARLRRIRQSEKPIDARSPSSSISDETI